MISNLIFLQRKRLGFLIGSALIAGLIYFTVVHCVMLFVSDPQSVPIIAQWIVGGVGGIALFIGTMSDCYTILPMSIRMSATRKQMVTALLAVHLLLIASIYLLSFAFGWLEGVLIHNVWMPMVPGLIIENMASDISWWATPAMLFGGMFVGYFLGAVFAQFGPKIGGYVLGGLWLTFIAMQNGMLFGEISPFQYVPDFVWGIGGILVVIWIFYAFLTMSVGSE